jgi:hypothetical protein
VCERKSAGPKPTRRRNGVLETRSEWVDLIGIFNVFFSNSKGHLGDALLGCNCRSRSGCLPFLAKVGSMEKRQCGGSTVTSPAPRWSRQRGTEHLSIGNGRHLSESNEGRLRSYALPKT